MTPPSASTNEELAERRVRLQDEIEAIDALIGARLTESGGEMLTTYQAPEMRGFIPPQPTTQPDIAPPTPLSEEARLPPEALYYAEYAERHGWISTLGDPSIGQGQSYAIQQTDGFRVFVLGNDEDARVLSRFPLLAAAYKQAAALLSRQTETIERLEHRLANNDWWCEECKQRYSGPPDEWSDRATCPKCGHWMLHNKEYQIERQAAEIEGLRKALEAALPRLAHRVECAGLNPTEEWPQRGSTNFDACKCEIAQARAALKEGKT